MLHHSLPFTFSVIDLSLTKMYFLKKDTKIIAGVAIGYMLTNFLATKLARNHVGDATVPYDIAGLNWDNFWVSLLVWML